PCTGSSASLPAHPEGGNKSAGWGTPFSLADPYIPGLVGILAALPPVDSSVHSFWHQDPYVPVPCQGLPVLADTYPMSACGLTSRLPVAAPAGSHDCLAAGRNFCPQYHPWPLGKF